MQYNNNIMVDDDGKGKDDYGGIGSLWSSALYLVITTWRKIWRELDSQPPSLLLLCVYM